MKNSHSGRRLALAVVTVLVAAIVVYGVFPYAATTSIGNLKAGTTVYLYGNVSSRFAVGGVSLFYLTQGNESVAVAWNGTLPATGSHVLVHGKVESSARVFGLGFQYILAYSVTQWYF